ncbi:flagellar protein FliT [Clostridium aciditolerans]|uniref:Flagellar protein FliT n=1 Tax=Clostridium aciditolerans TaxID=339861 RepID=A0A934HWS8_9CLOT|nr:flagellar protein FliT [Clostridium aciditolerans]MBI6872724.1 flagellar protein FliT [Clostridium aciditolerans]
MENVELKSQLEVYNSDTLKLIESLEKKDYDNLESLLNKRQQTIDNISKLDYTKQEFSEVAEELKILEHQKRLSDLMIRKRDDVKEELNKISSAKNASNMYNKKIYSNSRIFNKTI